MISLSIITKHKSAIAEEQAMETHLILTTKMEERAITKMLAELNVMLIPNALTLSILKATDGANYG
jgi:hypothetical protein